MPSFDRRLVAHSPRARLACALALALPVAVAPAGAQPLGLTSGADPSGSTVPSVQETREPPALLGPRDAAIAALFALGAVGVAPLDRALADRLQRPAVQRDRTLGRLATAGRVGVQPGLVILFPALYAAGRLADDRRTAALGLHGSEAIGVALVAVGAGKLLAGRARPSVPGRDPGSWRFGRGILGGGEYRSFPSGHTATAFAAAAVVTSRPTDARTRWLAGVPLYAAGALAGWSRMYDDRHWASDVVAGAAIGTVSGLAVARFHRTRPDNAIDRRLLGAMVRVVPGGGVRLSLVPTRVVVPPVRASARVASPAATAGR